MAIKVLFINTVNPSEEIESRYPALGIGYLVSSLRNHFGDNFFEFKVISADVEAVLENFNPDIAAITSVTQNFNIAKEHARIAKEKKIPVIIGGIHISMEPQSLTDDMDVGVAGEGEKTIVRLFELLVKNKTFNKEGLRDIKGIVFKDSDGKIVITQKEEEIFPLDNIPLPARDLFKIKGHSYLFSSRGCPYRCAFCASTHFWGRVRFFSAKYVVREIRELVEKYNVKLISFYDDLMIADLNRLKELVLLLKKEGLEKKVRFSLNARANLLTEEVVRLLKEMNVVSVGMGLESGNERILKYLKGDNIKVSDNSSAIKNLKKYKIAANASFVIGSPDETEEEILETYNFIKHSELDFFDTYVLTPFPGTPLWDAVLKRGLVSNEMDWSRLNVNFGKNFKKVVIVSQILSREKLYKLYQKFQKRRLFIAMKNLIRHPFFFDICGIMLGVVINKLKFLKNRKAS